MGVQTVVSCDQVLWIRRLVRYTREWDWHDAAEVGTSQQPEKSVSLHKLKSTVLAAALIATSALVVVLGLQNRSLRDVTRELVARAREPHQGFIVPTVNLETVFGDSVILGKTDSGHVQLLFVFATGCTHCRASLPGWNQINADLLQYPKSRSLGSQQTVWDRHGVSWQNTT